MMARTVFKYRLPPHIGITASIETRIGWTPLHVGIQRDGVFELPAIWILMDERAGREPVQIRSIGTGMYVPADSRYLGSALLQGGIDVIHYFQVF